MERNKINARIRNSFPELDDVIHIGDFTIDDGAHEFTYCEKVLDLPPTQYNLLRFLLINNGMVLSKSLILEKVWGYDFNGEENILGNEKSITTVKMMDSVLQQFDNMFPVNRWKATS